MEGNGTQQYVSLSGTVVGVVFHNAENGYTVLRVSTPEGTVTSMRKGILF